MTAATRPAKAAPQPSGNGPSRQQRRHPGKQNPAAAGGQVPFRMINAKRAKTPPPPPPVETVDIPEERQGELQARTLVIDELRQRAHRLLGEAQSAQFELTWLQEAMVELVRAEFNVDMRDGTGWKIVPDAAQRKLVLQREVPKPGAAPAVATTPEAIAEAVAAADANADRVDAVASAKNAIGEAVAQMGMGAGIAPTPAVAIAPEPDSVAE